MHCYAYSAAKGGVARIVKGKSASAYMLMYVREDCLNEIYCCNNDALLNNSDDNSNTKDVFAKINNHITTRRGSNGNNDQLKAFLITDDILNHNQRELGMLFHNKNDIDDTVRMLPLIAEYDLGTRETIDSIANIISVRTNTNKANIHLYAVTFNYNNRRIIFNAKHIRNTTTPINSIGLNSVSYHH